jgi:hypothetical protein
MSTACAAGPAAPASQGTLSCTGAGSTATGSTVGGTSGVGAAAPDHWFQFTANRTGPYTVSTCGSTFDTFVHVFQRLAGNIQGATVATCDDCGRFSGTRVWMRALLAL